MRPPWPLCAFSQSSSLPSHRYPGAPTSSSCRTIGLPQGDYFVVQGIYRGWALFGAVIIPAALANLALAILLRRDRRAFWLAFAAFLLIALSLAVFFTWTFPANQATANWTLAPANWAALRLQWEYSHAVNAVLIFTALCCASLGALLAPRR
jgi:hypothetical protein